MATKIFALIANFCIFACGHIDGPKPAELSRTEDLWAEIGADGLESKPVGTWTSAYWSRYHALSPGIRSNPRMARLVAFREMQHAETYDLGVWGKRNGVGHFASTTDKIRSDGRLYWVIVKALSEKYGCFMRERRTYANVNYFRCRDRRHVVFWQNRGHDWIEFFARQYDRNGDEIRVTNHRAIRTGRRLAQDVVAIKSKL